MSDDSEEKRLRDKRDTGRQAEINLNRFGNSIREKRQQEWKKRQEEEDDEEELVDDEPDIDIDEYRIEEPEKKQDDGKPDPREADRVADPAFNWESEISEAQDRWTEWRLSEDINEVEKLKNAIGRSWEYFKSNKTARDYIIDLGLPLTLAIYGLILLAVSFIIGGALLTEPNRIADVFLIDTIILIIATIVFVGARRAKQDLDDTKIDVWRRRFRLSVIGIHLLPTIAFVIVLIDFIGLNVVQSVASNFRDLRIFLYQDVLMNSPAEILADFGFWIWDVTPLGITIQQTGAIMFVVGVIMMTPFVWGVAKVVVVAINTEDTEEEDTKRFDSVFLIGEDRGQHKEPEREGIPTIREPKRSKKDSEDILSDVDDVLELVQETDSYKLKPYKGFVEKERYWVHKPYSYVAILHNEVSNEYRYHTVEPELTDTEEDIYEIFIDRLEDELLFDNVEEIAKERDVPIQEVKEDIFERKIISIATDYGLDLESMSFERISYYLKRFYVHHSKIEPIMRDDNIEDISCDKPDKPLFVYHQEYTDMKANVTFDEDELDEFVIRMSTQANKSISKENPTVNASLPDGSRVQLTLGYEVSEGSNFTVRKFQDIPFTPIDLIQTRTFSSEQIAFLWLCIEHDMSLIFAGGTASGKTTSLNAVSLFIPPNSKIVSIEDTRETSLPHHDNWIPTITRDAFGESGEEIDEYDLLEAALRQRPEYLLVGEIRGEEANDMFQAMSTGHTTFSTMHADDVQSAIFRLRNPPIDVPGEMISSLDLLCIQRQIYIGHDDEDRDEPKRVRRNEVIAELKWGNNEMDDTKIFKRLADIDEWDENLSRSETKEKIKQRTGWDDQKLSNELYTRLELLEYMMDNGIDDVEGVTRVVQAYMLNPDRVISKMEKGTLDPKEFADIGEAIPSDDSPAVQDVSTTSVSTGTLDDIEQ